MLNASVLLSRGTITSPPKVRRVVGIPCQFFSERTRPYTSFRNNAISVSNRGRKLIIFEFMNYETVLRDLNNSLQFFVNGFLTPKSSIISCRQNNDCGKNKRPSAVDETMF